MIEASNDLAVMVTLGDLLADASLSATAAVLPDGGVSRPVSWVHATEQLDPRPHLRTHELVCTLGSSLVRPHAAAAFVSALDESGVAGIALGLGEVHLSPPQALVIACREAGMPLLLLEHGVPFLAVNDAVLKLRNVIENKARNLETTLLTRLMSMARSGAEADALLAEASATLGGALTQDHESAGPPFTWTGATPRPSEAFLGQLESILEFSGIEQARAAVERQQQLGQLIDLITSGLAHPAAILPDIESQGLDSNTLQVSFWPAGSEGAIRRQWSIGLIGMTAQEVILITGPVPDESLRTLGLVCGFSAVVPVTSLRRAFTEARTALRLARNRGGVAGPSQLASLDALLEQQPAERLAPFAEQLAEPLIRADELGRGDLMMTLSAFIAEDRQLQVTADRLFVHVNTVRHRLAKVHELTGRDPLTLSGISDLHIAVWAVERQLAVGHRMIKPLGR